MNKHWKKFMHVVGNQPCETAVIFPHMYGLVFYMYIVLQQILSTKWPTGLPVSEQYSDLGQRYMYM